MNGEIRKTQERERAKKMNIQKKIPAEEMRMGQRGHNEKFKNGNCLRPKPRNT